MNNEDQFSLMQNALEIAMILARMEHIEQKKKILKKKERALEKNAKLLLGVLEEMK